MTATGEVVARIAECDDPVEAVSIARELVAALPRADVLYLAMERVLDEASTVRRRNALAAEREATRVTPIRRTPEEAAVVAERDRQYRADLARMEAEHRERFFAEMKRSLEQYAAELRVEWTADLLATGIAMPDGTQTTWGEATAEQHEQRARMFEQQAQAGLEGAARHRYAVRALQESAVLNLNSLMKAAA